MNCDQARDLFSDLREDSLGSRPREDVLAHLSECVDCRQLMDALGEVMASLANFPELEAPLGLHARAAEAALASESSAPLSFRLLPRMPDWIRGLAAALAIATTGTLFFVTREAHALSRASTRLTTRVVNMGAQVVERKERLVEDVRDLRALVSMAVTGRMERVGDRVEDYKRYLEKRRQGDVERKEGGLTSGAARVAEHFRTVGLGTS